MRISTRSTAVRDILATLPPGEYSMPALLRFIRSANPDALLMVAKPSACVSRILLLHFADTVRREGLVYHVGSPADVAAQPVAQSSDMAQLMSDVKHLVTMVGRILRTMGIHP